MKSNKLDLANELYVASKQIYAIGSLIGAQGEWDFDPSETNNGIFMILAEISKKLECLRDDVETQALAMQKSKSIKSEEAKSRKTPLTLVKEVSA